MGTMDSAVKNSAHIYSLVLLKLILLYTNVLQSLAGCIVYLFYIKYFLNTSIEYLLGLS